MKRILCLFKHDWMAYSPNRCRLRKECKRCGKVQTEIIDSTHKAIDFFQNYDKAISWCMKHNIEK